MQALLRINRQGCRNDNEEQGGGIGLVRPTFNHVPNIRNQIRPTVGFYGTLYEDADFGEFTNPRGRQREGRQWQPNYSGVDIPNFSGDLDIESFFHLNILSFPMTERLNLLLIS